MSDEFSDLELHESSFCIISTFCLPSCDLKKEPDNTYKIYVTRGWVGKPKLNYPIDFWYGLGIKNSNIYEMRKKEHESWFS